jgi:hypothetical protein
MRAIEEQKAATKRKESLDWFRDNYERISGYKMFLTNVHSGFKNITDPQVAKMVKDLKARDPQIKRTVIPIGKRHRRLG